MSDGDVVTLTVRQLETMALAAGKEAATEVSAKWFSALGVNISNTRDMENLRRDLSFMRHLRNGGEKSIFDILDIDGKNHKETKALREDLAFIRSFRSGAGRVSWTFTLTIVAAIGSGFLYGVWNALKLAFWGKGI
jgi:hypothetical protein